MVDFARFFDKSLDLNGIANADGYLRRVNSAWERTLAWTADELAAAPWIELVHPDDVAATTAQVESLRRGVPSISFENRYRCKDASYRWLRWSGSLDHDGLLFLEAHDITEQKRAAEALRASEADFRSLAESMPQIVWATRADGWNVYFNQQWVDYTGLTLEESYGHGWNAPFHPADRQRAWKAWQAATSTVGTYSLECRLRRADGAYLWWLVRGVPVRDASGAIAKWFGTCTDINEIKENQERMREERSRFESRALIDNLPELAWTARPDGFLDFYNRRWYDYTGTTFEDMQGWGWQSVHDPDELPRVMEGWTRSIALLEPFEQTFPLRRKDGVFRWFLTRVVPMFGDAGELIRWVGINTDVDDERRVQESLREAEERFRLALEGSPTGMIMVNGFGTIALINAQIERLFGYGRDELVGRPLEMLIPERFRGHHPGHRATFFANPQARSMGGGRDLFGLRKDGSEVPIEIGLNPLKTSAGNFVLSSVVDISERKRAQQELGEMAAVVEYTDDAILTKSLDGTIRSCNPGAVRLFGYRADELVGQPVMMLIPDDRVEEERMILEQIRLGKRDVHLETLRRRKDGTLVPVSLTVSPIYDRSGQLVAASKIMRDITERKQAEQERTRLVEQLQVLNVDLEARVRSRTTELSQTLRERESLLREKTSLLQEVHHRVKNNLQMISSLLNLQARQIKDGETRAIFLESQGRVRSIALLHESLYQSDDLGRVDMQEYVDKLVVTLMRTYGQTSSGARIVAAIERVHLPVDAAVPCGLIVNELVTNALKHAFVNAPDAARKEIRIEMRRVDGDMTLLVADNGPGFSGAVDPARDETMGLTLVRDLSAQLRGHAQFVTENGARCTVRFPVSREDDRS
ncbi:MAG: PAS domain S-box protein [Deltaproteobacteria bacterium]|nr:PAS domain S-box protein [Myxococcales bacterium]MDP3218041.1 PAS domain S-box protein [Deltaproteobacteria bacterium]